MAIIEPRDQSVKQLRGVHLYHFGMSQCAQRVRICLEEKGVAWTSHIVNLRKGEQYQQPYCDINPNNVVPTLVHDGTVIIESTDIIQYIDEGFSGPPLTPQQKPGAELLAQWLAQSNTLKPAIRLLSHEFLFKWVGRKSSAELEQIERVSSNTDLVDFHRSFSSTEGVAEAEVVAAIDGFYECFGLMDAQLRETSWLAGDTFSLADISWMGDVHRLSLMRFPFEDFPHLCDWLARVRSRPSFRDALLDYQPASIRYFFAFYSLFLALQGRSVGSRRRRYHGAAGSGGHA